MEKSKLETAIKLQERIHYLEYAISRLYNGDNLSFIEVRHNTKVIYLDTSMIKAIMDILKVQLEEAEKALDQL